MSLVCSFPRTSEKTGISLFEWKKKKKKESLWSLKMEDDSYNAINEEFS